ncbi:hypothetical protein SAMN04489752_0237 [Brevibacterium siliguriense]|uniref:Uncharacterized protein n=1 Tax=Brevibacterium siliguriense TaxID=1136497 RepID=A0A1H1LVZ8_9MICO|nr:hypothetical protein SAMN04489752_0237 [Brevibacterium siliguriense]
MNMKRIGAVSLAAATLASASLFGATAAQAGPSKYWSANFRNVETCSIGVKHYINHIENLGYTLRAGNCTPDDYGNPNSRYTGAVLYK